MQLELFPRRATVAPAHPDDAWVTGVLPDRTGMRAYVIVIRDANDPSPPPKAALHKDRDKTPHLTLRKQTIEWWRDQIAATLADGVARTFNALCVIVGGVTADICLGELPEHALWSLVAESRVAYSMMAPIKFRSNAAT